MSELQSYLVGFFFVAVIGFFAKGSGQYIRNDYDVGPSVGIGAVLVPLCGLIGIVYVILWVLAIDQVAYMMLPYIVAYLAGATLYDQAFPREVSWRVSAVGVISIPLSYHLVAPLL